MGNQDVIPIVKVDLHVHSKERSGCSIATEEELIVRARAMGLDAIVFTDHERLVPSSHLYELNQRHAPFRVFSGIEIHTQEGEDVLVYGLQDSRLERMSWSYADLHQFARAHGGYLVLAHPFRYREVILANIRDYPPDAIEARSQNIRPDLEHRIRETAAETGSAILCSSDAHSVEAIGKFYISLSDFADSDATLVALLRARAFVCMPQPEAPTH